jgi:hypothetical protein
MNIKNIIMGEKMILNYFINFTETSLKFFQMEIKEIKKEIEFEDYTNDIIIYLLKKEKSIN